MQYEQLKYVSEAKDPSLTIVTAQLVIKVIDNTGLVGRYADSSPYFRQSHVFTPFTHHLGYHGIRALYEKVEKRNLVVPFASWLNLQSASLAGIPADPVDERACYGAGRGWPIRMAKKARGAILQLDPLESMRMAYSLELQPAEPDGVDFSIRFHLARRPEAQPARLHASWPCYMNAYDDVRLFYPRGSADNWRWDSVGKKPDIILGEPVNYRHSQDSFRAEEQALPLGYGRIGDRCLIIMFSDPGVHLFVVNAGGHYFLSPVQNPAWDFEWTVQDYPLNKTIGFDGRLIYTRFEGPDRAVERYRQWIDSRR